MSTIVYRGPLRVRSGEANYKRPVQKKTSKRVLHSNKGPSGSVASGTSVPPSGLSRMVRRIAFWYRESSLGHWFPLIFADRANVFEGIINHFGKGKLSKIWNEKGKKADIKYNKTGYIAKTTAKIVVGLVVFGWMMMGREKKKRRR